MNSLKISLILLTLLLPLLSIFYKTQVNELSLIPKESSNQWNLEIGFNIKELIQESESDSFLFPKFETVYNQVVKGAQVSPSSLLKEMKGDHISSYLWTKESLGPIKRLVTSFKIKLEDTVHGKIMEEVVKESSRELKKYLFIPEDVGAQIRRLNSKLLTQDNQKREIIRKIYFYITEETLINDSYNTIEELIDLFEGDERTRAYLAVYLARQNKIPARVMLGKEIVGKKTTELELQNTYIPEILINNKWHPLSVNKATYKRIPPKTFILTRDIEKFSSLTQGNFYEVDVEPLMINEVDSKAYSKQLSESNQFMSALSLHKLPLSMRHVFYSILLIPLGTLVLSFARNIIGVQTFGIFTPILISLFFLETSFIAGTTFFLVVVLLGYAQRYLLDKFYLLAVPRLSILLTTVIIIYTFIVLFLHENSIPTLSGAAGLGYFPIVIITVFIERFSVLIAEEGLRNTLKSLLGTFFISTLCYFIFKDDFLRLAIFNHPELLFSVMGINLIIGSYKGYRFSELLRFKELLKSGKFNV